MKRLTLIIVLIVLWSCSPDTTGSKKPVISVSIIPQEYFIEQLAGDLVEVNVLIPTGASPATYEPTASQLSRLDQSDLYMKIGYIGFERSWMEKVRSVNPGMKIVDLSNGIEAIMEEEDDEHDHLHDHAHGGIDPHIWMSARNAKVISTNIYKELLHLLPDARQNLTNRYNRLNRSLDSLDRAISGMLDNKAGPGFMIYHPALGYFARDYQLKQYPLEIGGKEPSPAHMRWMIDLGREMEIPVIFMQSQFDQKNAEVLAGEIGAEIVQINPLDPDWYQQMLYIAGKLNQIP
jgi:zinc transport system substrate-binding protein